MRSSCSAAGSAGSSTMASAATRIFVLCLGYKANVITNFFLI